MMSFLFFLLFLCVNICLAQVCTVGVSGTYSTIQSALNGCNSGNGTIELILTGNFTENFIVPYAITSVTFATASYDGTFPPVPYISNVSATIHGYNHQVLNPSTALYFQGIALDGLLSGEPMFEPWLTNNNVTLDSCVVYDYNGNYSIRIEACSRAVSITSLNTRYQNVWGSSLYADAMEDIYVKGNIFARCGGYNGYSSVHLKHSFVSEGMYILSNNSHWLIVDAQPPTCTYPADFNGMTQCYNGTLQCYNSYDTQELKPNCQTTNMTYIDENTNETLTVYDYPIDCRVYRPCQCQDLSFLNTTSNNTITLTIGDIFYYTGLRINCTVPSGTQTLNSSQLVFTGSNAGDDGMGQMPPLTDTTHGYSLAPNIYLSGVINNTVSNCSCQQPSTNQTLDQVGLSCRYSMDNTSYCDNGIVSNYTCSVPYYITCTYNYTNPVNNQIQIYNNYYTYEDARGAPLQNNQLSNGNPMCVAFNQTLYYQDYYCQSQKEQDPSGYAQYGCRAPIVNSITTSFIMETFPFIGGVSSCGANYTCQNFTYTTCSCELNQVADCISTYEPGAYTAAYYIGHIADNTSVVDLTNNRAQQLPFGWLMDMTSEQIILNTTVEVPELSDESTRLREIYAQTNYLVTGTVHDFVYGQEGTASNIVPYRLHCDGGCPQTYQNVEDFTCIVDASTPVPKVNRTFQAIQDALNDSNCDSILVNNYENFYSEQLTFNSHNKILASLTGACVLGYGHIIDTNELTLRGMCFLHPGDQAQSLFETKKKMDYLYILNGYIDGGGVRGGGVLGIGDKHEIGDLVINHTTIQYWNYAAIVLNNVDYVWMAHNLFYNCFGRSVDIKYNYVFRFHDNALVQVRGVSNLHGVPMIRFTANSDDACSNTNETSYGGFGCIFFNNIQNTDVTDDDIKDVGFSIVGGLIQPSEIFDNCIVKANIGFQLRQLQAITAFTVPMLIRNNPLIRPNFFTTTIKPKDVYDWNYDEYIDSDIYGLQIPYVTLKCDFPCNYQSINYSVCTVNPNFDIGYLGIPGQNVAPFGYQNITSYGLGLFHNASQALMFCGIVRLNPYTKSIERPIYFTGNNGGSMFRDTLAINQTGVSFYGVLLSDEINVNPVCFPRSQIFGDGFQILADNFTTVNMTYVRDFDSMSYALSMFYTQPNIIPVFNANFTNNTFNGGSLSGYSDTRIIDLKLGYDTATYSADNSIQGGKIAPFIAHLPRRSATIVNNTFMGFVSYSEVLSDSNGEPYNVSVSDFPFVDPIYIQDLNEDVKTECHVKVDYNTFIDFDRRPADIRYCMNVSFSFNMLIDVGGRCPGNAAGVYIQANRETSLWNSSVYLLNNTMYQRKPILYDTTNSQVNPGYYSSITLRGYAEDGIMCIYNNNISGGAIGLRIVGSNNTAILSCINQTIDPPQFYDNQDVLRQIFFYNKNLTGYIHWLVIGEVYQDYFQNTIYCDDGCIPENPGACNVSATDPA